ncbi:heterokaryon incompatibility protein-domain-containing protein [Fusarium tricinctum]|uniref:Heterokaryon incompatibility protein-domain-containing protein n=1 Tax=Fusarium tricinctum TaxID=61284 RepID=A0A8K0RMX8_9HYPO|nr:heterokaryon incompatibility protein-domain-containing protein [Fusarium tricinctum]
MAICSLCLPTLRIPSQLPVFPESWHERASILECSSTPYFIRGKDATPIDQIGLLHHTDLDALSVSAEKCPLCKIISQKVKGFIQDFENMQQDPKLRYFVIERQGHGFPDKWTFRLVQRLDAADGFSVLVNSKSEKIIYLIDVFGFCVEPEDSLYSIPNEDADNAKALSARRVRGAKVGPDAGSKNTLSVVSGWVKHCVDEHERCRPPQTPLPSRILDLNAFDDPDNIRLWETNGATDYEPYVTLSYCWGSDPSVHVRTTHSTLSGHLERISVKGLPQTYQDAIKITRHLGIRFLWIDSLCICQDDLDDWTRESAAMQQVYAGAYLSIAADNAPSSTHGFLKRSDRMHVPVDLKVVNGSSDLDGTAPDSSVVDIPGYAFEAPPSKTFHNGCWLQLDKEPLTSRAWATQERLLPQRVLHFTSHQLRFECNCHTLSEDGAQVLGRWNSLRRGGEKNFKDIARKSRISYNHQMWYLILEDYTNRLLTANTDRLAAISGLAALFQEKMNAEESGNVVDNPGGVQYVAGLWSNALIEGLEWTSFRSRAKETTMPDEFPLPGEKGYIAPTWSWASFGGRSAHGNTSSGWADLAVPTGFNVILKSSQNPFGEVVNGWISLRAPMIKTELSELPEPDEDKLSGFRRNMRLCTPRGNPFGAYSSFDGLRGHTDETRSWVKKNELFALVLSEGKNLWYTTDDNVSYHALLIMPIEEEKRVEAGRKEFRRVGTIRFDSKCVGDDEEMLRDSSGFVEVVLV